jgi:hypothetical protein
VQKQYLSLLTGERHFIIDAIFEMHLEALLLVRRLLTNGADVAIHRPRDPLPARDAQSAGLDLQHLLVQLQARLDQLQTFFFQFRFPFLFPLNEKHLLTTGMNQSTCLNGTSGLSPVFSTLRFGGFGRGWVFIVRWSRSLPYLSGSTVLRTC